MNIYNLYLYLCSYVSFIFHSLSLINITSSVDSPCCFQCPNNTLKYYSIDTTTNRCSETCLPDHLYSFYSYFKPEFIHDSHTFYPCYTYGYTRYNITNRYNIWHIKIEFDVYDQHVNIGYD